ncbi:MAG: M48 family metallopeptidase [Erysipelotrichaceae bacterium]|nr:M48 family metallopeptidase [Erysipelotrichaceae bacterium]
MINKADIKDVLIIDEIKIPLLIKYKRKLQISFRFLEGCLVVSAPNQAKVTDIKEALLKKKTWILKHHHLSEGHRLNQNELRLHDRRVGVMFQSGSTFSYSFNEDSLVIIHPSRMKEENALKHFKQDYSEKILVPIFEKACVEMNLRPISLSLRDTKSSHGRCNSKHQITLSIRLIEYSYDYIRYVCIHELAHLRHMNHSKAFYGLVKLYCPEYKKLVAQVRTVVL